jgi:hypothetical protein
MGAPTPVPDPARAELARALEPDYRLGSLVGRGGFAEVWAAFDPALKRDVAVKVLRADLAHAPGFVERFRREAEAAAGLRHPNIVPIYGIGDRAGIVYFTMPLVRGESLADWLAREPLPPLDEARRILGDVADALHAAHREGIVHRDVKPENIMLEGDERRVLVMDFGIAKALAHPGGALTGTGVIVGTPHYMSPEQGSGEGGVDHRSDVYSLGVVAYQMVTGRVPFPAGSVVAVLVRHATEPPPPVRDLRPECPADLVEAIERCLEKDPGRRWASAADLRDAFRTASTLAPHPSAARVSTPIEVRLARGTRRTVLVAGVVMLAGIALDLVLGGGVEFAPFVLLATLTVGALAWGRAAVAGLSVSDVLRPSGARRAATPVPHFEADLGSHASAVRQARADRATVLGLLARMPAAERKALGEALPELDRRLAEAAELARQVRSLERSLERLADRAERHRAEGRRTELLGRLRADLSDIHEIRVAVRYAARDGLVPAAQRLATVLGRREF